MDYLTYASLIGAGATAIMDIAAVLRHRLLGTPPADYALVGRWLAYLPRGRFRHDPISGSAAVRHERLIGWTSHYLIGIAFAGVLLAIWGQSWVCHPSMVPALTVGLASVAAPFLLMQPGMGAGFAASRSPNPAAARLRSLVTHGIFGFGLYASAWLIGALHFFP